MTTDEIDAEIKALKRRKAKLEKLQALRLEVANLEGCRLGTDLKAATIMIVQAEVCSAFNLTLDALALKSRVENIVRPRQVLWYIERDLLKMSYKNIARLFDKNHGTVMSGIARVGNLMDSNPAFAGVVQRIRSNVEKQIAACAPEPQ